MAQTWSSVQKLAVVPTFNKQFDTGAVPNDWENQIMRRVLYDPDPVSGADRSLRGYLGAISYGRATLDVKLFPRAFANGPAVIEAAWQSLPAGHGYPFVLCVIPLYDGDRDRNGFFETVNKNGVQAVARVAMNDRTPQLRRETMGVWSMEVLHAIARLPDLYATQGNPFPAPEIGAYDNMARNSGAHCCSYLKQAAGWLGSGAFVTHAGASKDYVLHAIGMSPPPPGRFSAVRIPARTSSNTFIVEARLAVDVYERGFAPMENGAMEFTGVGREGVIVYEVTTTAHLEQVRLSSAGLQAGQSYVNSAEGFTVRAGSLQPNGGVNIHITRTADPRCPDLLQRIADLDDAISEEKDPRVLSQLRAQRRTLNDQAESFGCK